MPCRVKAGNQYHYSSRVLVASAYLRFQINLTRTADTHSQIHAIVHTCVSACCIRYVITRTHISISVSSACENQHSLFVCSFFMFSYSASHRFYRGTTDERNDRAKLCGKHMFLVTRHKCDSHRMQIVQESPNYFLQNLIRREIKRFWNCILLMISMFQFRENKCRILKVYLCV